MVLRISIAFLSVLLAAVISPQAASAQADLAFPTRYIKLVVPLAGGGGGDVLARLFAAKMSATLGQTVVVENRPGAATIVGSDYVAKSKPDGYTLLLATSSNVINGSLYKLPFDPIKDFSGVSLIATSPLMLAVNSKLPVKTLPELIALAKTEPGKLNFASSGNASVPHLSGEMLNRMAGIHMTHIPYKGSGPAETDLLGGQVQLYFASPASAGSHIRSGALRALAISSAKRSPAFPDVPTVAETLPGFNTATLYVLLAPAGTPKAILDTLNRAVVKATLLPEVKAQLDTMGVDLVGSTGPAAMVYMKKQIDQWAKIIKDTNIKVE